MMQKSSDKIVYGGEQQPRGRTNFGNRKNMCLYWIRKYAKEIEPKERPNARVNVIEMDELYSFVERKNRFYAITLVSRDIRESVGFDIAFDKGRERIQRLVDRSVKARQYYSDAYCVYLKVNCEGDHNLPKQASNLHLLRRKIRFTPSSSSFASAFKVLFALQKHQESFSKVLLAL